MRRYARSSSFKEFCFYVFTLLLIVLCINAVNYLRLIQASRIVPLMNSQYEPVRFILHSYADNSITARFWFYDMTGKEIGSYERSWPGYALSLEIRHFTCSSASFSIPVRLINMSSFGELTSRGTDISRYFFTKGIPAFISPAVADIHPFNINKLSYLFRFTADSSILNAPFFIFKDTFLTSQYLNLEMCELGEYYSVRCSQGNAVIIR